MIAGVSEWKIFGYDSVEHHLHVVPYVRVPVLVDSQGGARVKELDVHEADRKLGQLG